MEIELSSDERRVCIQQFPDCPLDLLQQKENIIFLSPDEFSGERNEIANKLQLSFDFLKEITDINIPSRVIIGYNQCTQPTWSGDRGNSVYVPWKKLNTANEPLDICSHELIHPFFRYSPLHMRNEGWGEGFCDFLRGPVKNKMGLDGDDWWKRMIKDGEQQPKGSIPYPAGQFVLKLCERNSGKSTIDLINDNAALREYVEFLFCNYQSTSLSTFIVPSPKMTEKWNGKDKI